MVSSKTLVALVLSQVGNRESPFGSNRGPQIKKYGDTTGAYGYAWCVSMGQWVLRKLGIGPVANNTAGVFYLESFARARGWTRSRPLPGMGVCFMRGQGHFGFVVGVAGNMITTVEGNAGNAVTKREHVIDSNMVFIEFPGVTRKPVYVRVPRFRLVHKNGKPITVWQKWSSLDQRVPQILAKHSNEVKVQRKVIKVRKA